MVTMMAPQSLSRMTMYALVVVTLLLVESVLAFQPLLGGCRFSNTARASRSSCLKASSVSSAITDTTSTNVASMKQSLSSLIASTDRGRSASPQQQTEIENALQQLEEQCTLKSPANSPLVDGSWIVDYTTAPPPSNGQLGPFSGIARQVVSLDGGTYRNLLAVPPNDWLTALLDATWEEWDGTYLDDDESSPLQDTMNTAPNIGGSCWKVTFESLTIRLFHIPLFSQKFHNVQRIWRTTYVDDDTRIVRAGRTGRQDDEMTFYMTRES